MRKIVSAVLAAGLLGAATVASATPAAFSVGIYLGSGARAHSAPAPVVVHERPVYAAPAHHAPAYVAPAHAAPHRAPAHSLERAPRGHGAYGAGYRPLHR